MMICHLGLKALTMRTQRIPSWKCNEFGMQNAKRSSRQSWERSLLVLEQLFRIHPRPCMDNFSSQLNSWKIQSLEEVFSPLLRQQQESRSTIAQAARPNHQTLVNTLLDSLNWILINVVHKSWRSINTWAASESRRKRDNKLGFVYNRSKSWTSTTALQLKSQAHKRRDSPKSIMRSSRDN